jgi:hypothetical protein
MKMIVCLFLSVVFAGYARAQAELSPELRPFLLPGYFALDSRSGDLNGDGKKDAILILKRDDEDSLMEEEPVRPFLILIRDGRGQLKQSVRNDSLVMCRYCGGVFGDPYADLEISNKGFTIFFYGGSGWRWSYDYRFNYDAVKKDWYLAKETLNSFQSGDPENTREETIITKEELGNISVRDFSAGHNYEYSAWTVTAPKSYFYNTPKLGSTPRKGYVVKGNTVSVSRVLKNFVWASYETANGEISSGFLLKKDLRKPTTTH